VSDKVVVQTPSGDATAADGAAASGNEQVTVDALYGKTKDDRLTLVTSASALPTNGSDATVVVAKLQGQPFAPTPQGGRTDDQTGLSGEAAAWSSLLLAVVIAVGSVALAVWFFRRCSRPVAYLLSVAPLIGAFIVLGETISRLLPAWW